MSSILKRGVLVLFVLLLCSLSFLAGYGFSHQPVVAAVNIPQTSPPSDAVERFKLLWEAWDWVDREYYGRPSLDGSKVTYGAIRGMLQSLGDPHTYFVDPEERRIDDAQLQGEFDGIGVYVEMKEDGKLRVLAPQEGSPGERAGMQAGDVIVQVDGKRIAGLTLVQAVSLIRGPRGTRVALVIEREGLSEPWAVEVERAEIKVESVRAKLLDQGVAYIRISQFGAQTGRELIDALKKLTGGTAGLVLDLRANPGGYLGTAVDVASQFLGDGVVLYEERQNGERQEFRVKRGGLATDLKMVVLVDKGSASASEIVAGALQDYQRAQLIGEKTFGKGSMQSVHGLSDGSSIHVTIAHWLTPKGRPIDGDGLAPDVPVEKPTSAVAGHDPQLDRAVAILLGGELSSSGDGTRSPE